MSCNTGVAHGSLGLIFTSVWGGGGGVEVSLGPITLSPIVYYRHTTTVLLT